MSTADGTVLTDRQLEVLEYRERGYTQQEVATELGTTDSNVSAIERSARENVEKAKQTLRVVRTLQSPVRFTVPAGTTFDALVDDVYAQGDAADVRIAYCRPELYSHLYNKLRSQTAQNCLTVDVEVGLAEDGSVDVLFEASSDVEM